DRIEPGGIDDDVELVLGITGLDAPGRNPLDRRVPEIDEQHVGRIVDFVIVGLQWYAPSPESVVPRNQLFGGLRIPDPFANLAPDELADGDVRGWVGQDVAGAPHPATT